MDLAPAIVACFAFLAMAGVVFVIGQYSLRSMHMRKRLSVPQTSSVALDVGGNISRLVARHFHEKRFGVDDTLRGKLRLNLIRAGYFRSEAISFYVFWRVASVVLVPLLAYAGLGVFLPNVQLSRVLLVLVIAVVIGIVAPDAFISRRQRMLSTQYRVVFPDFLDLLVVCVDAGLTLESAINRIAGEIGERINRIFAMNLAAMTAEMRAGRSFIDALDALAERLMIPEARALVALLRQSLELGSDVGEALRVYSDEMRDRRLLRAEERANKLSVKMILPLALFIMPVVFMVVLLPVVLRLMEAFK
jgi:tight adherence protein C